MARNDGVNRTVARNGTYTRAQIGNIERHNERKNELYQNTDIQLERSDLNVHFKNPTDGYLTTFDKMCADGMITTKGLRDNAVIMDEMLFDVNTTYFENRGGYEYAKEFFARAYDYAVQEAGGEEYILSAVMHADERNQEVSGVMGKDIYHYHLHVMYVPVVQKEVRWSKRCKDKSLVGTVKEVITQVSHSKKWASHKVIGEDGTPYFQKSYSLLQDRFFEHMRDCGYRDVARGEKGSTEQNLTTTQFKVGQEEKRLEETAAKVMTREKSLSKITEKQTKIKAVDSIATKAPLMDKSKVIVDQSAFEDIKILAQKQIATQDKEKKILTENRQLKQSMKTLQQEHQTVKNELYEYKSVKKQLNAGRDAVRLAELEKFKDVVMKFLDFMGLREKFEKFRQRKTTKTRQEVK